jgi:hypothetical protein
MPPFLLLWRNDRWLQGLLDRLVNLESKVQGFSIEQLALDENFLSAVTQASYSAIKTHESSKLEALQNAVINTALRGPFSPNRETIFLNLIDSHTEEHIKMLSFFRNPKRWFGYEDSEQVIQFEPPMQAVSGEGASSRKQNYEDIVVNRLSGIILSNSDRVRKETIILLKDTIWSTFYDPKISSLGLEYLNFISVPNAELATHD